MHKHIHPDYIDVCCTQRVPVDELFECARVRVMLPPVIYLELPAPVSVHTPNIGPAQRTECASIRNIRNQSSQMTGLPGS